VLVTGQVTAGTTSSALCQMPPGPCTLVVSNPSSSVIVYVGPGGTALTTGNGFPVPAGQSAAWAGYQGDKGAALNVIAASGTANTVGFLISSATGQTGP
jgi:hypothetical protein